MNPPTILLITGCVLVLLGLISGGIELKGAKISGLSQGGRGIALAIGVCLIGLGIWLNARAPSAPAAAPTVYVLPIQGGGLPVAVPGESTRTAPLPAPGGAAAPEPRQTAAFRAQSAASDEKPWGNDTLRGTELTAKMLQEGRTQEVFDTFAGPLQLIVSLSRLKEIMANMEAKVGRISSVGIARKIKAPPGYESASEVLCRTDNGQLLVRVFYDDESAPLAFWVYPGRPDAANESAGPAPSESTDSRAQPPANNERPWGVDTLKGTEMAARLLQERKYQELFDTFSSSLRVSFPLSKLESLSAQMESQIGRISSVGIARKIKAPPGSESASEVLCKGDKGQLLVRMFYDGDSAPIGFWVYPGPLE